MRVQKHSREDITTGPPRALDQDELAFLREVESEECERERQEQLEVKRALHEFKVCCQNRKCS